MTDLQIGFAVGMVFQAIVGVAVDVFWRRRTKRRAASTPPDWLPEPGELFSVSVREADTRGMPSAILRCIATDTRVIVAREVPINGVAYPHAQVLARSQYEAHPVGESVAQALEIKT